MCLHWNKYLKSMCEAVYNTFYFCIVAKKTLTAYATIYQII